MQMFDINIYTLIGTLIIIHGLINLLRGYIMYYDNKNLEKKAVESRVLYFKKENDGWIMKFERNEKDEFHVKFNREDFPNLAADEFARKVIDLLEEMPMFKKSAEEN